jgi:DNA-binding LacI/PurR family transcriptional regulator/serine phosphatase RsbU (regulator of sigma subunit)
MDGSDAVGNPASRRTRPTVGILSDAIDDWYQNTVFSGAAQALRDLGASVVIFNGGTLRSPDIVESGRNAVFDLVDASRVDGLLVLTPLADAIGAEGLSAYCWRYAAVPVCSLAVELPGRPAVLVDNLGGMGQLVEHMIVDHGRRRVAFVRGPRTSAEAEGRFETYRASLAKHGLAFDPELVVDGDFRTPSGVAAVRVLLDDRGVDFDALVAANDSMALGAMEALQARGIAVPGRVGVGGFDDMDEGRFATPPLTTVRQPIYESARRAGQLLFALIRKETTPSRVVVPTEVVVRESCGCTLDEAVASRAPAQFSVVTSLASHLVARRPALLEALRRAVPVDPTGGAGDWAESLVDSFLSDLGDPAGRRFVEAMLATLRRVVDGGGTLRSWHAALAVLRTASMSTEGDPAGMARARQLLHRGRVVIGDLRERLQAQHRLRREHWIRRLHETSEAFTRSFGEDALVEAVSSELPRWRIPAAAIALYDRTGNRPTTRARPLFLYDDGVRLPADPSQKFASCELAPAGWIDARPRTLVAEPLAFRGEQYGFALFEKGPSEGEVYEGLRRLLSSAMKGANLVADVVQGATARQVAERQRLEKEMEMAARIQTSLVQSAVKVPGLDLATTMIPATEVGGDYYDVVPFDGVCWLGVGDVAGHGLQTGLVMLIIQSAVSALVREDPHSSPGDAVATVNAVMFQSVRERMGQDEHATLLLLRYEDGRVVHAGAHEEILVYRAREGRCERIETLGPVFGAVPDVSSVVRDARFELEVGDLVVLYTDGLTEAMDAGGLTLGVERVCGVIEAAGGRTAAEVLDAILRTAREWMIEHRDDISVVVARRTA